MPRTRSLVRARARPWVLLLGVLPGVVGPARAPAQEVLPAIAGGVGGLAAGTFVAVGVVSAEARRGNYLYSLRDAFGWRSTPILLGTASGVALGLAGWDRLGRAGLGGLVGGVGGAMVGTAYGALRWREAEGRWAGGVIGGAAGLVLGVTIAALRDLGRDPPDGPAARDPVVGAGARRIPIVVRIALP